MPASATRAPSASPSRWSTTSSTRPRPRTQLGKTAGKDAAAQKATYVSVHGLAGAQDLAARLLTEAEEATSAFGSRGDELRGIARLIVERRS